METTIYIDSLALLNGVINYLLLFASSRLVDVPRRRWRIALGALLGAAYAVAVIFPAFAWLAGPVGKVVCAAGMVLIAFGGLPWRRLLRVSGIFLFVSALLAGCVLAVGLLTGRGVGPGGLLYLPIDGKTLLMTTGVSYALLSVLFRRVGGRPPQGSADVSVRWGDRTHTFTALLDSGHSLTDPFTGAPVLVVEWQTAYPLLPRGIRGRISAEGLCDPPRLMEELLLLPPGEDFVAADRENRLRLLPYRAVGTELGFLLAVRPDEVTVGGKKLNRALLALSPTRVSDDARHTAIISG